MIRYYLVLSLALTSSFSSPAYSQVCFFPEDSPEAGIVFTGRAEAVVVPTTVRLYAVLGATDTNLESAWKLLNEKQQQVREDAARLGYESDSLEFSKVERLTRVADQHVFNTSNTPPVTEFTANPSEEYTLTVAFKADWRIGPDDEPILLASRIADQCRERPWFSTIADLPLYPCKNCRLPPLMFALQGGISEEDNLKYIEEARRQAHEAASRFGEMNQDVLGQLTSISVTESDPLDAFGRGYHTAVQPLYFGHYFTTHPLDLFRREAGELIGPLHYELQRTIAVRLRYALMSN